MTDPNHPASGDLEAVVRRLILAADCYGVRYLDSDDMTEEAEELQSATEAAKDALALCPANPPATAAGVGEAWRDIATAPKDGTEFQAWWSGQWQPRARFDPEYGSFQLCGRTDFDTEGWEVFKLPTHWMPEPQAPGTTPASHDALIARVREVLEPFARFIEVLDTMGGNTPRKGTYCAIESHAAGEAEITIEDFNAARALLTDLDARDGG